MSTPTTPTDILETIFKRVSSNVSESVTDKHTSKDIEFVCRGKGRSGACTRLLLACALAKVVNPEIDIRKPYTAIGGTDSYSGRAYDEQYVSSFINMHNLPCNSTTAFLTPAFRNKSETLTPETRLAVRAGSNLLYQTTLKLLTDVYDGRITAEALLIEVIRWLLTIRDENRLRIDTLRANLRSSRETTALSSEDIVVLIQQHLSSPKSSRLLVLIVAAVYESASEYLKERALPLEAHNAADKQTGSAGDVEVTLIGDNNVVTVYEMKDKKVTKNDIDHALQKVGTSIDNYIFVTTEVIVDEVKEYTHAMYARTGIEFIVLDCIGFLRHFLHLFHRVRTQFLEAYQRLVLEDSAVSQPLKETFLALRFAAESVEEGENDTE